MRLFKVKGWFIQYVTYCMSQRVTGGPKVALPRSQGDNVTHIQEINLVRSGISRLEKI